MGFISFCCSISCKACLLREVLHRTTTQSVDTYAVISFNDSILFYKILRLATHPRRDVIKDDAGANFQGLLAGEGNVRCDYRIFSMA